MKNQTRTTYPLVILTLEEIIFSDEVRSLIVPGVVGYFEVLPHHAPLVSLIQPGLVTIHTPQGKKLLYEISQGLIEVSREEVFLFADAIHERFGT
jgi:F-type H+-transporting ATPase subunit epsilon